MSAESPATRILLVEDDAAIREALNEVLAELGYEVVSASDGRRGLALAAQQPVPCPILLDWRMPVLDGPEALGEPVARAAMPGTSCVIFPAQPSGWSV